MTEDRREAIWQGLIVGLIGYATIAVGVSALDILQGRSPFFTVSLLGEWLFYGLRDPNQVTVWPGAVFAYNGVHLVTFVAFGLMSSWLASISEHRPLYWYGALVLYLFVFVHLLAAVQLMTEPLRALIPLYQIWVPSLLAVILMSGYLLQVRPVLRREMSRWDDNAEEVAEEHGAV